MRERVSVIHGKSPIILVAPRGFDDLHTTTIVEKAAKMLDSHAVINRGFECAATVDVLKDKADCNRIDHCKEEVVYDEFLKPLKKAKDKVFHKGYYQTAASLGATYVPLDMLPSVHVFHIIGCGNFVHDEVKDVVEVALGWGLGIKKDSITCERWRKNLFVDLWRNLVAATGDIYEGKGGGKFAGRDANSLNQYFSKHEEDATVQSMQLAIPLSMRDSERKATHLAVCLAIVLEKYVAFSGYQSVVPTSKFV